MVARKIRDADDARSCLAAAEASGLSRVEWARAHAIDARSLNAWRLNLARRDEPRGELRLVELVPAQPARREPVQYRVRCGEFVVEVDDRFDDDVLGQLLTVVATC